MIGKLILTTENTKKRGGEVLAPFQHFYEFSFKCFLEKYLKIFFVYDRIRMLIYYNFCFSEKEYLMDENNKS